MNRLKEVINLLESQTSKYPSVVGATLGGAAAIVGASSLNSPIAALLIVLALLGIKERTRQSRLTGNGADDKAEPLLDTVVVAEHELKDRELEVETLRQRNAELLRRISDLEAQVKAYASQPKPQEVPSAQKRSSSIDIASNSSRASEQSDPSAADPSLLSTSPPAHPPVASLASLAGGALPSQNAYVRPAATTVHPVAAAAVLRKHAPSYSEHSIEPAMAAPEMAKVRIEGLGRNSSGSGRAVRSSPMAPRSDTRVVASELAEAADQMANEAQAPLHVEIDNECDGICTVVRVIAPDRAQLLTDLTSALSGLGLSIERASISTVGKQAINSFHLLEKHSDGQKRKVRGKKRLASIEQRLRLQFRRREMQRLLKTTALGPTAPPSASGDSVGDGASKTGLLLPWSHNPLRPSFTTIPEESPDGGVPSDAPGAREGGTGGGGDSTDHSDVPDAAEASLLDGLSQALAVGWGGSFGALAPSLARKLAEQVLPGMRRVAIPEGTTWDFEGEGEWLLLLETPAMASLVPHSAAYSSGSGRRGRDSRDSLANSDDGDGFGSSFTSSPTPFATSTGDLQALRSANADVRRLGAGSVLWEFAHIIGETGVTAGAGGGLPRWLSMWNESHTDPSNGDGAEDATAAAAATGGGGGEGGGGGGGGDGGGQTIVRCAHRSQLRKTLITLREALTRSHAARLAELPLFSPLEPTELINFCRRATEVEFLPGKAIRPVRNDGHDAFASEPSSYPRAPDYNPSALVAAGVSQGPNAAQRQERTSHGSDSLDGAEAAAAAGALAALGPRTIPHDAFALILAGDVILSVPNTHHSRRTDSSAGPTGSSSLPLADDVSKALKASGTFQLPNASGDVELELPPRIPLARLDAGLTLGNTGELLSPSNVSATAGDQGCVLLVWRREASVTYELSRMQLLLPTSWQAQAPLAVVAHVPDLIQMLRPLSLPQLQAMPAAWQAQHASLTLVLSGELTESTEVEVELKYIGDGGNGGGGEKDKDAVAGGEVYELKVTIDGRDRLLADLTATLSDLALDVLDGDIATDEFGRAVDTLRVRDVGGSRGSREGSFRGGSLFGGSRNPSGDFGSGSFAASSPSSPKLSSDSGLGRRATRHSFDDATSPAERAATLKERVQRRLREVLSTTRLKPGEHTASPLTLSSASEHDVPMVAWVDMRALGAVLALDRNALGAGVRAFLRCHHKALIPYLATAQAQIDPRQVTDDSGRGGRAFLGLGATEGSSDVVVNGFSRVLTAHIANTTNAANAAARENVLGGSTADWSAAVTGYFLRTLREAAGRGDEGIQLHQLERGPELGAGACGVVHLARDVLSGRVYAIKSFHMPADETKQKTILRYLDREREILRLLSDSDRQRGSKNRWFVHLVCAGQERNAMQLVMPACLGGELWNILNEFGAMSESEARFYMACLTLALQRLHKLGIVYRDLKPENVLLRHDGWPIIADFGLSSFMLGEKPLYSLCGTPEFMAPEVIGATGSAGYGAAADWWSLGVLLCQCLTLNTPFVDPQQRPRKTFDNVLRGRKTVPPELEHHRIVSQHAASMIDSLLTTDVGRRLGGRNRGEIRAHPFFWGLDWEKLERREMEPPHADYTADRARETSRLAFHK